MKLGPAEHHGAKRKVVSGTSPKQFSGRRYPKSGIAGMFVAVGATIMVMSGGASAQPSLKAAPAFSRSALMPDTAGNTDGFAGYLANPDNGFASASTTFVAPAESNCSNNTGLVFGVLGTSGGTSAGIYACGPGGGYDYLAETPAGVVEEPATPGDTIVASVFETGKWTEAEVHDITNGQYWDATYTANAGDTGVDIGVETDEGPPIVSFPAVSFTLCEVNGDYLGFESPERLRATAFETNRVLMSSGSLTDHGTSFRVTFKQSE
jgi:hypothetical protein